MFLIIAHAETQDTQEQPAVNTLEGDLTNAHKNLNILSSLLLPSLVTYIFLFSLLCAHMYILVLVWRPEVDTGCLPQLLVTLLFEAGSH